MRSPIIAVERGGEIHVFSTVNEAESYLEPDDIAADEYDLYDGDGLVLSASIYKKDQGPLAPEKIRLSNTERDGKKVLEEQIRSYFARVGTTIGNGATLSTMLEELMRYARS